MAACVLTLWRPQLPYEYRYKASCARQTGLAVICNFWHPGTLTLRTECQSARMSKITNDGRLNLLWHRMLYRCTHVATVGVKGLTPPYQWRHASTSTSRDDVTGTCWGRASGPSASVSYSSCQSFSLVYIFEWTDGFLFHCSFIPARAAVTHCAMLGQVSHSTCLYEKDTFCLQAVKLYKRT